MIGERRGSSWSGGGDEAAWGHTARATNASGWPSPPPSTGYGFFNPLSTWPFATLEIEPRALVLRGPGIHYVFSREGVAVEAFRSLFSPGLRFLHADPAVPPYVVFWTFQPRAVKASLTAHGYTVAAPA